MVITNNYDLLIGHKVTSYLNDIQPLTLFNIGCKYSNCATLFLSDLASKLLPFFINYGSCAL